MPGSGPSGAGNSIGLTVVHSTTVSVSRSSNSPVSPSSTHFLSSSLSSSTSNSATVVNTFNKLLTTSQSPQTTTSSASSSSASSVGHIDPSPISSSVTFKASATTIFTVTKGLDVSHAIVPPDASSSVTYTKVILSTLPPTTTSSSATPVAYDPASLGSTSCSLTTQSGYMSFAPVPATLDASSTWAASFANHEHHATGASTSDSTPEPTSRRVPTSNPTRVSSIVSGATISTESASTSTHHIVSKPPKAPQQAVSASIPVSTQTTQSGSNLLTMITSGSLVVIPTASSNVSPDSLSTSNSLLPFILGPVLGVLVIVALGMTIFRCYVRRRTKNMSNVLSSGSETSWDRKDRMMIEDIPPVNAVTLGQRITSYRGSSTYAPEHIITRLSHAGESSQNSNEQFSDPFADSSEIVSSRTSMLPASIHSVDSVSTNLAFTVSVNADARDVGEFESSIDASTSSLELHFVAPLATDESLTPSPYLSPSWHYDGLSPTSSPRQGEHWNEAQQGETSPVSLQASPPVTPKPFLLGSESARLRLHALLKEARGISYEQENTRSARGNVR